MRMCRPEVNIGPWDDEFRGIKEASQALNWTERHPTAYWKGNPDVVSYLRIKLLHCNDSRAWGAQIVRQVKFSKHNIPLSPHHSYLSGYDVCYQWVGCLNIIVICFVWQNWAEEARSGFEQSKLSRQCHHRWVTVHHHHHHWNGNNLISICPYLFRGIFGLLPFLLPPPCT